MQKSSPFLLLETSTERSVIGLVDCGAVLFERQLPPGLNNSKLLALAVHEGLKEAGLQVADLGAVATGIGPGSYTGIRVGVMLAKTLAYAANLPLIGMCTLQCFTPPSEGPFAVVIDAKISGAYVITGLKKNGQVVFNDEPQVVALPDLKAKLEGIDTLLTPQAKQLRAKLEPSFINAAWHELAPDLKQMGQLAEKKMLSGQFVLDGALELLYLRKTQAEIELLEKKSTRSSDHAQK